MTRKDKIITLTMATIFAGLVLTFAWAMAWTVSIIFGH